jgi:hypothetical protein
MENFVKILFKYPTRERPNLFRNTLNTWIKLLSNKFDHEFIITMDNNDKTMNNDIFRRYLDGIPKLKYFYGDSKTKIEAVNANMEDIDFDILVLVSDDMIPQIKGYDEIIVNKMLENFPEMDGALHFNDGCCGRDTTITLSILGKKLYDYFGYIYHPSYKSFYCDNEFTEVVYREKKCIYIPQIIIKHCWKGWGGSDILYKKNDILGKGDSEIFYSRKQNGFLK